MILDSCWKLLQVRELEFVVFIGSLYDNICEDLFKLMNFYAQITFLLSKRVSIIIYFISNNEVIGEKSV